MIAVIMGVTGSGKTTIGTLLASREGWEYAEGDDYHSKENVARMHAGIPLTDADRAPWLRTLHRVLLGWYNSGKGGVLACSALKQTYRELLQGSIPASDLRFVLLEVPKDVLAERMKHRAGHFMNPSLLDSQLATLEIPSDALRVSAVQPPEDAVEEIVNELKDSKKEGYRQSKTHR
ncbi:MAG: gluconokinase [Acidobacteriaceae bacterium]